jgi:hypothetical protein
MLFGETVAIYCENHTEHTDTLCGQNLEFWCVKAGGTYSDHKSRSAGKETPVLLRNRKRYYRATLCSKHVITG